MPSENTPESESVDREILLKELKKRLAEIEELKRQLGMDTSSEKEERASPYSPEHVRDAIEEIVVPALEMLDDAPFPRKKKQTSLA